MDTCEHTCIPAQREVPVFTPPWAAWLCPRVPSGPCPHTSTDMWPSCWERARGHSHTSLAPAPQCHAAHPPWHGVHGVQSMSRQSPRLQPRGRLGEASVLLSALGVLMR